MKKIITVIIGILYFFPSSLFSQGKLVGINTDAPSAQLDIVSKDNTGSTKAIEINNKDNLEMITILNNGNTGINTINPVAQLEVSAPSNTKSAVRLRTLSGTNMRQAASVNYNAFRQLVADNNGNVYVKYNPALENANAITFDGTYTSTTTNKTLCTLNNGSIVRFSVLSGFAYGQAGVGGIIHADIIWSKDKGFRLTRKAYNIAGNVNPMTITGEGTDLLTFDFAIGSDMIFQVTGNNLVYRETERTNGFQVMKSFRTR